jgi:hypothetical protein
MPVKVAIVDSGVGAAFDAAVISRVALAAGDDGRVRCRGRMRRRHRRR